MTFNTKTWLTVAFFSLLFIAILTGMGIWLLPTAEDLILATKLKWLFVFLGALDVVLNIWVARTTINRHNNIQLNKGNL